MMMQKAMDPAYYHLCEIAKLVDTEWFARTQVLLCSIMS